MIKIGNLPQILYQIFTAEKTQQTLQPKPEIEQKWFTTQIQKEMEQKKREVQNLKGSKEVKIETKGERRGSQRRANRGESKDKKEERKSPESPGYRHEYPGKHIDVII